MAFRNTKTLIERKDSNQNPWEKKRKIKITSLISALSRKPWLKSEESRKTLKIGKLHGANCN